MGIFDDFLRRTALQRASAEQNRSNFNARYQMPNTVPNWQSNMAYGFSQQMPNSVAGWIGQLLGMRHPLQGSSGRATPVGPPGAPNYTVPPITPGNNFAGTMPIDDLIGGAPALRLPGGSGYAQDPMVRAGRMNKLRTRQAEILGK